MRKARSESSGKAEGHLRRTETWNGLLPGDAVRIAGIRGGHWRYRCHVVNERNGATWVEVAELDVPRLATSVARAASASADARTLRARRLRSFAPERVIPLRRRRRVRPASPGQGVLELGLADGEPATRTVIRAPRRPEHASLASPEDAPRLFAMEDADSTT